MFHRGKKKTIAADSKNNTYIYIYIHEMHTELLLYSILQSITLCTITTNPTATALALIHGLSKVLILLLLYYCLLYITIAYIFIHVKSNSIPVS